MVTRKPSEQRRSETKKEKERYAREIIELRLKHGLSADQDDPAYWDQSLWPPVGERTSAQVLRVSLVRRLLGEIIQSKRAALATGLQLQPEEEQRERRALMRELAAVADFRSKELKKRLQEVPEVTYSADDMRRILKDPDHYAKHCHDTFKARAQRLLEPRMQLGLLPAVLEAARPQGLLPVGHHHRLGVRVRVTD